MTCFLENSNVLRNERKQSSSLLAGYKRQIRKFETTTQKMDQLQTTTMPKSLDCLLADIFSSKHKSTSWKSPNYYCIIFVKKKSVSWAIESPKFVSDKAATNYSVSLIWFNMQKNRIETRVYDARIPIIKSRLVLAIENLPKVHNVYADFLKSDHLWIFICPEMM